MIVDEAYVQQQQQQQLQLQAEANYYVSESHEVDTGDYEDHTFCGVMFDIKCKGDDIPLDCLIISSIWVRGALGPLQVTRELGRLGPGTARDDFG